MNHNEIAIDVKDLSKSFNGKLAVDNVSIKVKKGEIFGFLGPNGSGKTTTIRMLCGLLTPDFGSGVCLGHDFRKESDKIKSRTGYMTQRFSLYEELTIYENLDFMARLYNVPNRAVVVEKAIADLGLTDRQDQFAGTLSGGWKQRLALSAALIHQPELLLLDEPTAGVDPKARREFWDHIYYLSTQGITTLVSTHYMDEAERCHRLGYIFFGKIMALGTKEEIIVQANLNTWSLNGEGIKLMEVSEKVRHLPGVDQVAVFGSSLHVSGKDRELLRASLMQCEAANAHFMQIAPSLEDVFISLSGKEKVILED